jgi:Predicted transcriptional regulator
MLDATQCGGLQNCRQAQRCMTHELWSTLNDRIYEFLSSVTLADEVKKQRQINDTELPALRNVRSNSELQPQQLMAL